MSHNLPKSPEYWVAASLRIPKAQQEFMAAAFE
jgi:hypothetical protein